MIRDAETLAPIASAAVELLDSDETVLTTAISGGNGLFVLVAPGAGTYHVRAWRIGMDTLLHGPIELSGGSTEQLDLLLRSRAVELEGVTVSVSAAEQRLEQRGFYQRQRNSGGAFLTPEVIEGRNAQRTIDLMRSVPGLTFREGRSAVAQPTLMTRAGDLIEQRRGEKCLPVIYVDGLTVQPGGPDPFGGGEFDLTTLQVWTIIGLEVYTTNVPVRFSAPNSQCGVIVIWTIAG